MEIAVITGLSAKRNMKINACHPAKVRRFVSLLFSLILLLPGVSRAQYLLHVTPVDKDSAFIRNKLGIPASFKTREAATAYIFNLVPLLQAKGYVTASIDTVHYGKEEATVRLYLGTSWRWANID